MEKALEQPVIVSNQPEVAGAIAAILGGDVDIGFLNCLQTKYLVKARKGAGFYNADSIEINHECPDRNRTGL